jgi:hypothetical protein
MAAQSKLYIYDKSSRIDRWQAAGRFSGDNEVLTIGVSSGVKNLQKVFESLAGNNQKFNRVVFQTHGSPGAIYFGNESVNAATWKTLFRGYETMFPVYTRMYFDGCNVAEGGFGTDFLIAAGSVFFLLEVAKRSVGKHGNWPAGIHIGLCGHTIHFGGGSNLKKIRFFRGGQPNWPDSRV